MEPTIIANGVSYRYEGIDWSNHQEHLNEIAMETTYTSLALLFASGPTPPALDLLAGALALWADLCGIPHFH